MYSVYVLRSQSSGRLYVGYASDVTQRLGQHNHGISKSTKNRGPWELVYSEEFETRIEAMGRERRLKTGRGREELKRTLKGNTTVK
jgi:putative endonuclease